MKVALTLGRRVGAGYRFRWRRRHGCRANRQRSANPTLPSISQLTRPHPALGAKVIAAAGSETKLKVSKDQGGADYAVDYTKPNWQKEVLKITGGKGVDVVYDPVGLIRGPYLPSPADNY